MQSPRFGISTAILCILLGILVVFAARFVLTQSAPEFVPQANSVILKPPTNAIYGTLSQSEGGVKQLVRDASDFTEATPSGVIRQGEALATAQGTATVTLPTLGTLMFGEHTELSFVNLVPTAPLVQQKSGSVRYHLENPLSIRALHSLIVGNGDIEISIEEGSVTASVEQGSLTLGIIDTTNSTHTYTVEQGQKILIDDETRRVRIR